MSNLPTGLTARVEGHERRDRLAVRAFPTASSSFGESAAWMSGSVSRIG